MPRSGGVPLSPTSPPPPHALAASRWTAVDVRNARNTPALDIKRRALDIKRAHMPGLHGRSAPTIRDRGRTSTQRARPWLAGLGAAALIVIVWAAVPGVEGVGEPLLSPPPTLPPAEGPVLLLEVVYGVEFVVVGGRTTENCLDLNIADPFPIYAGEACGSDLLQRAVGGSVVDVRGRTYAVAFGLAPVEATSVIVADPVDGVETSVALRGGFWLHAEELGARPGTPFQRHLVFVNGLGEELRTDAVDFDPTG